MGRVWGRVLRPPRSFRDEIGALHVKAAGSICPQIFTCKSRSGSLSSKEFDGFDCKESSFNSSKFDLEFSKQHLENPIYRNAVGFHHNP